MINISNNLDLKNKQSKTNSHLIKHITRELEHYQNKNIHTELDKVEGMTFEQIQEYTDSRKEKGMN
ncbi:hypothetical protein FACS1894218_1690 [Bacilli bacterium]|nr:hypothetical protein FACS1894218_1690 [Bacilli bacterium]